MTSLLLSENLSKITVAPYKEDPKESFKIGSISKKKSSINAVLNYPENTDFEITKPQIIKFFDKFEVSIIHITFAKDFTGIFYPSLINLYFNYMIQIITKNNKYKSLKY